MYDDQEESVFLYYEEIKEIQRYVCSMLTDICSNVVTNLLSIHFIYHYLAQANLNLKQQQDTMVLHHCNLMFCKCFKYYIQNYKQRHINYTRVCTTF